MSATAAVLECAETVPHDEPNESAPTWAVCTGDDTKATVSGFEVRRYAESSIFALWRKSTDDSPEVRIGSGLWVRGMARDAEGLGWCHVVAFVDCDCTLRQWLMPRELLAADRSDLIRHLLGRGYDAVLSKEARDGLVAYLGATPKDRFTTVTSIGWHGESFVLPDRAIGPGAYLLAATPAAATLPGGTIDRWRKHVALPCRGNTRLTFALSLAFASPLLAVDGMESGGVHLVGGSSVGKSTAAHVARSAWGVELQSWRATDNGLEGVAARHSDVGLVLDEIGQVDGRIVGEVAYMLANGQGKGRAARDGGDRARLSWRLLFLSTGETTLAKHMGDSGKRARAGQELRLVSIEADAGAGMGLFENIHGLPAPAAFADRLVEACKANHGHAGPKFVERLVADIAGARTIIEQVRTRFDRDIGLDDADGQVQRVARRFALIAAAGELATEYGLTGWAPGTAIGSAIECFGAWRASWAPAGSREAERAIEAVVSFLQTQASRFQTRDHDAERHPIRDRAGFVIQGEPDEWLIYPSTFREEVCNGLRVEQVTEALISLGHLTPGSDGKRQIQRRADGRSQRFYVVRGSVLEGGRV